MTDRSSGDHYVANGEVGLVGNGKAPWLNVVFAGRPNLRFGYSGRDFPGGSGPLELAYAITVHKSQGSEFQKVFVVLPKNCRPSRASCSTRPLPGRAASSCS